MVDTCAVSGSGTGGPVSGYRGSRTISRARVMVAVGVLLVLGGGLAAVAAVADTGAGREVAATLPGFAGAPRPAVVEAEVSFAGTGLVDRRGWADVDGDGIADRVEEALCGSATCAVPWADVDGDGVPDVVDVLVCGTAGCVDPRVDSDGDRIPDFVGVLLCGPGGCPAGVLRGDVDGDGVENWVEALIAGDAVSATGVRTSMVMVWRMLPR